MNVRRTAAIVLQVVGAATLAFVALISIQILQYHYNESGGSRTPYGRSALEFVLEQSGADRKQAWTIIDSSMSSRSYTGNHVDYACIQLVDAPRLAGASGWVAQEHDDVMKDIVSVALNHARSEGATCIPNEQQVNSVEFPRLVRRAVLNGRSSASAEVILFEPAQLRLYYVEYKT